MLAQLFQSCLTLCNPMDCSSPGTSLFGILQARVLSGLPSPPPGDLHDLQNRTHISPVSGIAGGFFIHWPMWEAPIKVYLPYTAAAAKSFQSCQTLCDPVDGSPLSSPCPWDSPGKNIGVGCHFLLQCVKVKVKVKVKSLSHVGLFMTPWTAAYQTPSSMGFSRQEYWSGLPLPSLFLTLDPYNFVNLCLAGCGICSDIRAGLKKPWDWNAGRPPEIFVWLCLVLVIQALTVTTLLWRQRQLRPRKEDSAQIFHMHSPK